MSFGDMFNVLDLVYKAVEQDPLSFMVVYPMTLMTSSMLLFALIQDLIPVYKTKFAHASVKPAVKAQAVSVNKRQLKAGRRVQFSN